MDANGSRFTQTGDIDGKGGARSTSTPSIGAWETPLTYTPVNPSGIATTEAFGTAKTQLGIAATGIATALAFGSAFIGRVLSPSGIASAQAFGSVTVVAVTSTLTDALRDENGALVLSTQFDYSLSLTWNGAEVQNGNVTSNGSGVYSITITTGAGAVRYMRYKKTGADTHHGLKKLTSV